MVISDDTSTPCWVLFFLEIVRCLIENYKSPYKDSQGNDYYLECEPSDELYYTFAKIKYGDTIEYYDYYVPGKEIGMEGCLRIDMFLENKTLL